MSEHAYDSPMSTRTERIEVVTRSERRRRWSDADKQRILQETLAPGATVAGVAKRHEVGTGQIYTWRRQALAGAVGGFVPIRIEEDPSGKPDHMAAAPALPAPGSLPSPPRGTIEIELPTGTRLRVGGDVDGGALRRVLAALGAR
jgi:transposase